MRLSSQSKIRSRERDTDLRYLADAPSRNIYAVSYFAGFARIKDARGTITHQKISYELTESCEHIHSTSVSVPKLPIRSADANYLVVNSFKFETQISKSEWFPEFCPTAPSLLKNLKVKHSKYLLLLAVVTVVAAARFWPGSRVADGRVSGPAFIDPMTACINQYNSIVTSSKASPARGDRNGTIKLLFAARAQLGKCEEIHNNSTASVSLGLNNSGAAVLTDTPPLCSRGDLPDERRLEGLSISDGLT
jgi:hypothetical protein